MPEGCESSINSGDSICETSGLVAFALKEQGLNL